MSANRSYRPSCLWEDDGRVDVASTRRAVNFDLDGLDCDVIVIGAGFTGLWTAFYLSRADPNLDIAVLEARTVGFGASGRNGGWCSPLLPMSLAKISREHGRDSAMSSRRAMVETVHEVGSRIEELGLECGYAKGGSIELLRNPSQRDRAMQHVRTMRALSIPESEIRIVSGKDLDHLVRTRDAQEALFDTESAVLHPGRLTRSLAEVVRSQGCRIYEGVTALRVEPGRITTDKGCLRASTIIRATEAFTTELEGEHRSVIPLYSLMIATEPLGADIWSQIGLESRPSFTDGRRILVYGQRTADDRIAFGGRGAPYHFGSRIRPEFDTNERVARHLVEALNDILPQTKHARITHHWGGPLAAPRDWNSTVRYDPRTGMGSAGGYVGDGVATSNLAARILVDLVLGRASRLTNLPWVHHSSPKWEPEPIRWFAVNGMARLAALADRHENRSGRSARTIDALVRRVSGK